MASKLYGSVPPAFLDLAPQVFLPLLPLVSLCASAPDHHLQCSESRAATLRPSLEAAAAGGAAAAKRVITALAINHHMLLAIFFAKKGGG